jgi:hypothetical protein
MKFDLKPLLYILFIFGMIVVGIVWGISSSFKKDTIEVSKPIVPEMKIEIENGIADTIYIYQIP